MAGIGASPRRWEDARLLRGLGSFTDDALADRALHACFVRSPHAAARLVGLDVAAACDMPGVAAVFTGEDMAALGLLPCAVPRHLPDGRPMPRPPYRALSIGHAAHVGDAIALVAAETLAQARDAAEAVIVTWDTLPAVTDARAALGPGAPEVWPGLAPGNLAFEHRVGNHAGVAAALGQAAHVVDLDLRVSRVVGAAIEARAAQAQWDAGEERWTLRCGVQTPHWVRDELASVMGVPASKLRLMSPDMGGSFGLRGQPAPEHAALLFAARALGRPVRWAADRTEAMLADPHGRDGHLRVELGLDADGTFLALRLTSEANLGAYLSLMGPHASTNNLGGLAGTYRTPLIAAVVRGAFTHTQPLAPYRGAGRPEASYAIERAIDVAARRLGLPPEELRWRNLIPPGAMPFRTGLTYTYDSGDFPRGMAMALAAADAAGFPARRAASLGRGMLRGLGIANAIEISAGPPGRPLPEVVSLRLLADGSAVAQVGTHSHGQGHETMYRQLAKAFLGLDGGSVRVVQGDTDAVAAGRGSFGSRSVVAGGTAFHVAAARLVARGTVIAAHLLECAEADIEFEAGAGFCVAGTDRRLGWREIAAAAHTPGRLPAGQDIGLTATAETAPGDATFPNGCQICEVEVDPETGLVTVLAHVVVEDVGTVINPRLVKGQVHGGVAQGIGQALWEEARFDAASGQLLSASFMDYALPRAADLPAIAVVSNPQPTSTNPLGAKGAGEAGTVGALPAAIAAVCDALGVDHLDMPLTPERVWAALQPRENCQ